MQNGDHYNGKVLSLTNDLVVLQSDILGAITIPRAKVAKIALSNGAASLPAGKTAEAASTRIEPPKGGTPNTNSVPSELAALRNSSTARSDAEKVKQQILADADPAARAKFDEMLGDLLNGKMTIADLRVQAKSAADQLRGLKKELGPEADPTLDGYLAVLESFLREVPAESGITRTNVSIGLARPKSKDEKEE
jgi:hypothetical protein